MEKWFDVAAALFAFGAAVFWFLSAYGKLPPMVTHWDATPENDPFRMAVTFSAKMNRWLLHLVAYRRCAWRSGSWSRDEWLEQTIRSRCRCVGACRAISVGVREQQGPRQDVQLVL
jgi:hypothetical protein